MDLGYGPREEAQALLMAATRREAVPLGRLVAFARAVLQEDVVGRLALAVFDGGPFVGRRALELASTVLGGAEEAGQSGVAADVVDLDVQRSKRER